MAQDVIELNATNVHWHTDFESCLLRNNHFKVLIEFLPCIIS